MNKLPHKEHKEPPKRPSKKVVHTPEPEKPAEPKPDHGKRRRTLFITTGVFLFIALVVLLYWLLVLRFEEYTNDAYVSGNQVHLASQVEGIIKSINVDNTDYVTEGQTILELDSTDFQIAFEKSKAELAQAVRNVAQLFQNVDELKAEVNVKKALLVKAEIDYNNRINLVDIGGVSKEDFEHIQISLSEAIFSLNQTEHQLKAAQVLVNNTTVRTHPLVIQAKDSVKKSWVNLNRCQILSPINGFVAQRTVQLGQSVAPSNPLLTIIPLNEIWIDANYKEVQLSKMRVGQSVTVTSDLYGRRVKYQGKVIGIGAGTGSTFSAIPPQNATGNWIKIVQRVPVRIGLKEDELKKNPLWLGLSTEIRVDISNTEGSMLQSEKSLKPIYTTDIYQKQIEGIDQIIEKIIVENNG